GLKAGIKSGDRILYANGDTLFGKHKSSKELRDILKGRKGDPVSITLYRKEDDSLISLDVVRDVVPIKSVEASYMLTDSLGYIKINRFAESTYNEFKTALSSLKSTGATALVLDLRGNP